MEDLRRVTRDEVPRDKRWQYDAVWEMELDRVKKWLEEVANVNVGKAGITLDAALEAGSSLSEEIRARFGADVDTVDPTLMKNASLGKLEQSAPSLGLISTFGFLRWVCMSCETLIFFWLWLMGFGNEVLIVIGAMLAGSGFLLGLGSGRLMLAHEEGAVVRDFKGWASAVIGLLGIILIAIMRSRGADAEGAFAIVGTTVFLALLIAIFEALHSSMSHRYKEFHDKEFRCQRWFSTTQHQKVHSDGLWSAIYRDAVKMIFNDKGNNEAPRVSPFLKQQGSS